MFLFDDVIMIRYGIQGVYLLNNEVSYQLILQSHEAVRYGFTLLFQWLYILTTVSAALLWRRLTNFRAIEQLKPLSHSFEIPQDAMITSLNF